MEIIENKKCTLCGNTYPTSFFYRKKTAKDGFESCCKKCMSTRQRERRHLRERKFRQQDLSLGLAQVSEPPPILHVPGIRRGLVFMPYDGTDRCVRCYLSDFSIDICKKVKCTSEEHDSISGYYRASSAEEL